VPVGKGAEPFPSSPSSSQRAMKRSLNAS
jgi:hypothetical protein